ncbi:hypothetical protein [Oceanobacillus sp. CFH 90083]|uniref:hypothetical protein n=1 Tax=Oceanobacillus sp. CFH 90083 TaxID=2592336 RepID=UPI0018838163|nr:hypothetical protein [Oceanobacillus sp. CFH 90083]
MEDDKNKEDKTSLKILTAWFSILKILRVGLFLRIMLIFSIIGWEKSIQPYL